VGFAAKLERSNSIDRAWASLAKRSARQTWAFSRAARASVSCSVIAAPERSLPELVWASVGRLLRLRQEYLDFETQKWWCRIRRDVDYPGL
jgi:hypothetical protein